MSDMTSLNDIQKQAVLSDEEVLVIRAGAGSGKTRVITQRVIYLIKEKNVLPSSIVCVTFTNKAAKEMLQRIQGVLAKENLSEFPTITTFHSYALSLIRQFGSMKDIAHFTVLGDDDQTEIMKQIMQKYGFNSKEITVRDALGYIGKIKNRFGQSFLDYPEEKRLKLQELYQLYEYQKKSSCAFDFDDLLLQALELLRDPVVKNILQKSIQYVLVDEYQDTNLVQHDIIKELAYDLNKKFILKSLCIVGDEDQAIYSWRGANSHNITYFKRDFPQAKDIFLTQNYRSTNPIVALANVVISKNKERIPKELWSNKNTQHRITVISYYNGYSEAEGTIRMIQKIKEQNKDSTIAILYRSHYQSRVFEEYCVTYSIPYRVLGGINFYERQEIKDILSYATLAINGRSRIAFMRCCNTPERGLGEVFLESFMGFWNKYIQEDVIAVIHNYCAENKTTPRVQKSLQFIAGIIEEIRKIIHAPHRALEYIINEIGYFNYIIQKADTEEESRNRTENIGELLEAAKTFEKIYQPSLSDFLDHVSLMYEHDTKDQQQGGHVLLMSLHAAKGLEFSTVFLVGMEDGIFPNMKAFDSKGISEEERRLLYVGITRACDRLFCSYARQRTMWGTTRIQEKSSFFDDFKYDNIDWIDVSSVPKYNVDKILQNILQNNPPEEQNIKKTTQYIEPKNLFKNNNTHNKDHEPSNSSQQRFKPAQKVHHAVFGQGTVLVAEKDCVMVKFSSGVKRIKNEFIIENN